MTSRLIAILRVYAISGVSHKRVFLYYCFYSYQSLATKGFFSLFLNFALILTKALPQTVFSLYFCHYSNQSPTKKVFLLRLAIFLPKPYQKACNSPFLLYSNQSPTKKGIFPYLTLILTKALPQKVFYSIFAIILT